MFITAEEMRSVMYSYQIQQITEGDDTIVLMGINAAIAEVKSYISGNSKKEWLDGRPIYDVAAIFAKTGDDRNPLLMEICKVVAEWHIIKLANVDIIYEQIKERYDRSIAYLKMIASGEVTLTDVDLIATNSEEAQARQPFVMTSRTKFNHE